MIRARFKIKGEDGRAMVWPVQLPFWITGYSATHAIVVAYVRDLSTLYWLWPDAEGVDCEEVGLVVPSHDRFPLPEWFHQNSIPVFFDNACSGLLVLPTPLFELFMSGNEVNFVVPSEIPAITPVAAPQPTCLLPRIAVRMSYDRILIPGPMSALALKCFESYLRKT